MTEKIRKNTKEIVLSILCIVFGITTFVLAVDKYYPSEVETIIRRDYIDEYPSDEELEIGRMRGLVSSLNDKHSVYMTAEEAQEFENVMDDIYEGIGVYFDILEGEFVIDEVIEGGPAEASGLLAGDLLKYVDGVSTDTFYDFDDLSEAVMGKKDTDVEIGVLRGENFLNFTVTRAQIELEQVVLEIYDDVAVIEITSFGSGLDLDLQKTALDVLAEGEVDKIILDLRSNSGGRMEESIEVASYFLEPNTLVVKEIEKNDENLHYSKNKDYTLKDYDLVVLVDKYTASASEIIVGCLRDHRNAPIIGQRTYGKGVVQQIYELSNRDSLKLTVAYWNTPDNYNIDGEGFIPDIKIRIVDDALEKVLEDYSWKTQEMKK